LSTKEIEKFGTESQEIEKLRMELARACRELEKLKKYVACLETDLAFELTQRS
jgi:hypothetical protein